MGSIMSQQLRMMSGLSPRDPNYSRFYFNVIEDLLTCALQRLVLQLVGQFAEQSTASGVRSEQLAD